MVEAQESWRPPWAPHVVGRHERWDSTERTPIRYQCECERCGAVWQGECGTGRVRAHVERFARQHLHRDPLATAGKSGG